MTEIKTVGTGGWFFRRSEHITKKWTPVFRKKTRETKNPEHVRDPDSIRRTLKAHDLYTIIAGFFGAVFVLLVPPFGVGDETAHLERTYEVATGQWLGADGIPAGLLEFKDRAFTKIVDGEAFSPEVIIDLAEIEMSKDEIVPYPNPLRRTLRVNNPVAYAHLAPVMGIGLAVGLKPFWIIYLCRFASLALGLFLIREAIRIIPFQNHTLALIALFPTPVFLFAGVNVESAIIGLSFLFFAYIAYHAQADKRGVKITTAETVKLIALAFILGPLKSAYFLLALLVLLIPAERFVSRRHRFLTVMLAFFPALIVSLTWSMMISQFVIGDIIYTTNNLENVQPKEQLKWVFSDIFGFLGVLSRTVFATDLIASAWFSMLGRLGWSAIALNPLIYSGLAVTLGLCWCSGQAPPPAFRGAGPLTLQFGIFTTTIGIVLCLLYLQWSGVGAATVAGFQGRYILPVIPMLLAATTVRLPGLAAEHRRLVLVAAMSIIALGSAVMATLTHYY